MVTASAIYMRQGKAKWLDRRWVVRKTPAGYTIKNVDAIFHIPRRARTCDVDRIKANVKLVKNAPRMYHCIDKIIDLLRDRAFTSLDEKRINDNAYLRSKIESLQKIHSDMEYWIDNAEKLLDIIDYIWDGVEDEEWKTKGMNYGGIYSGTMRSNQR